MADLSWCWKTGSGGLDGVDRQDTVHGRASQVGTPIKLAPHNVASLAHSLTSSPLTVSSRIQTHPPNLAIHDAGVPFNYASHYKVTRLLQPPAPYTLALPA